MQGMQVQPLSQEDPLEEGMATRSSVPAWSILWTEEPGAAVPGATQSGTRLSVHIRYNHLLGGWPWQPWCSWRLPCGREPPPS